MMELRGEYVCDVMCRMNSALCLLISLCLILLALAPIFAQPPSTIPLPDLPLPHIHAAGNHQVQHLYNNMPQLDAVIHPRHCTSVAQATRPTFSALYVPILTSALHRAEWIDESVYQRVMHSHRHGGHMRHLLHHHAAHFKHAVEIVVRWLQSNPYDPAILAAAHQLAATVYIHADLQTYIMDQVVNRFVSSWGERVQVPNSPSLVSVGEWLSYDTLAEVQQHAAQPQAAWPEWIWQAATNMMQHCASIMQQAIQVGIVDPAFSVSRNTVPAVPHLSSPLASTPHSAVAGGHGAWNYPSISTNPPVPSSYIDNPSNLLPAAAAPSIPANSPSVARDIPAPTVAANSPVYAQAASSEPVAANTAVSSSSSPGSAVSPWPCSAVQLCCRLPNLCPNQDMQKWKGAPRCFIVNMHLLGGHVERFFLAVCQESGNTRVRAPAPGSSARVEEAHYTWLTQRNDQPNVAERYSVLLYSSDVMRIQYHAHLHSYAVHVRTQRGYVRPGISCTGSIQQQDMLCTNEVINAMVIGQNGEPVPIENVTVDPYVALTGTRYPFQFHATLSSTFLHHAQQFVSVDQNGQWTQGIAAQANVLFNVQHVVQVLASPILSDGVSSDQRLAGVVPLYLRCKQKSDAEQIGDEAFSVPTVSTPGVLSAQQQQLQSASPQATAISMQPTNSSSMASTSDYASSSSSSSSSHAPLTPSNQLLGKRASDSSPDSPSGKRMDNGLAHTGPGSPYAVTDPVLHQHPVVQQNQQEIRNAPNHPLELLLPPSAASMSHQQLAEAMNDSHLPVLHSPFSFDSSPIQPQADSAMDQQQRYSYEEEDQPNDDHWPHRSAEHEDSYEEDRDLIWVGPSPRLTDFPNPYAASPFGMALQEYSFGNPYVAQLPESEQYDPTQLPHLLYVDSNNLLANIDTVSASTNACIAAADTSLPQTVESHNAAVHNTMSVPEQQQHLADHDMPACANPPARRRGTARARHSASATVAGSSAAQGSGVIAPQTGIPPASLDIYGSQHHVSVLSVQRQSRNAALYNVQHWDVHAGLPSPMARAVEAAAAASAQVSQAAISTPPVATTTVTTASTCTTGSIAPSAAIPLSSNQSGLSLRERADGHVFYLVNNDS